MKRSGSQSFLAFILVIGLSSCSSSYKPVMLERYSYTDDQISNGVHVSYAHNVQYVSRNRWYTKKEKKFGMIAVAVRVENKTERAVELDPQRLKVLGPNGVGRRLYTPTEYGEKVRQRTGRHLLHALYGPWIFTWETDSYGNIDTNVIFLPVGAVIGIGNAIRAGKANRINVETLERNAIWNTVVEPGEVVYGTILIAGLHGDELSFFYEP